MDEFSYLAVLISIVLGLGITRLLTGFGALIEFRDRVRLYGPALVWTTVLLLVHIQTWWSMFGLQNHARWTFLAFLVVLLQPIVLYLLSALVLPTVTPGTAVDLRDHYYEQSRWFFGLFGALLVVSFIKEVTLEGRLPYTLNLGFHLVFLTLAVVGAVTKSAWFHRLNAATTLALVTFYIAVLFSQLG